VVAVALTLAGLLAVGPAGAGKFLTKKRADRRYVRDDQTATGHLSFSGLACQPRNDGMTYGPGGNLSVGRSSNSGGTFHCGLPLPHGATVSAARFSVNDASATESVDCRLGRFRISSPFLDYIEMSEIGTTDAGTPGDQELDDPTITDPVVDARNYAYFAECVLGATLNVAFYGGSIEYQMPVAAGLAA
jgi:hypothetical protein